MMESPTENMAAGKNSVTFSDDDTVHIEMNSPEAVTDWDRVYVGIAQASDDMDPSGMARTDVNVGRSVAHRALKWLLCQQRGLTEAEFIAAITTGADGSYGPDISREEVCRLCRDMIRFDEDARAFDFTHPTVRVYFERRPEYTEVDLHAMASATCIDILKRDETGDQALREYASQFWPIHFQKADVLTPQIRDFLFDGPDVASGFERWMSIAPPGPSFQNLTDKEWKQHRLTARFQNRRDEEWEQHRRMASIQSESPQSPQLFFACAFNLPSILQVYLDRPGFDVHERNRRGLPLLAVAATEGSLDVARRLLDHGADVNAEGDRTTPLLCAVRFHHADVVELLLSRGARFDTFGQFDQEDDINNSYRSYPLQLALWDEQETIVRLLLANEAYSTVSECAELRGVNNAAGKGNAPIVRMLLDRGFGTHHLDQPAIGALFRAMEGGNPEVVQMLLERGGDPTVSTVEGRQALDLAFQSGNETIVRLLLDRAAAEAGPEPDLDVALYKAARPGNEATVRLLLERGADVNTVFDHGGTVLCQALTGAGRGDIAELVRLLVTAGADVNANNVARTNVGHMTLRGRDTTALHLMAATGDEALVQLLLDHGGDIHARSAHGATVLAEAACRRETEGVVRLLIERGADIHATDARGESVLHYATRSGSVATVETLLEHGADVRALSRSGESVLTFSRREVARLLIDRGVDVDAPLRVGGPALIQATSLGDDVLVRRLIESGADVSVPARGGGTMLHTAASLIEHKSGVAIMQLGVDAGLDVNAKDKSGTTPLQLAAKSGNSDLVRLLLRTGADVNAVDANGRTVLHQAVLDDEETTRILLDNGANPGVSDRESKTLLHEAAASAQVAIARLLLGRGVEVNARDSGGNTALHSAAASYTGAKSYGKPKLEETDVVRLLLENGANVAATNERDETALHLVASGGRHKTVQLLLEHAADVMALDGAGRTILHRAVKEGNEGVVRSLVERGVDVTARDHAGTTVLHQAVKDADAAVIRLLLERGARESIQATDGEGNTLIHAAAGSYGRQTRVGGMCGKSEDVLPLVLGLGLDVRAKNGAGRTVMHGMTRRFHGEIGAVRLLLDAGADMEEVDDTGGTALHYAVNGDDVMQQCTGQYFKHDLARVLLSRGANTRAVDASGATPLHLAARYGHWEFVPMLLKRGADPDAVDDEGFTALARAEAEGFHTTHGWGGSSKSSLYDSERRLAMIKLLREATRDSEEGSPHPRKEGDRSETSDSGHSDDEGDDSDGDIGHGDERCDDRAPTTRSTNSDNPFSTPSPSTPRQSQGLDASEDVSHIEEEDSRPVAQRICGTARLHEARRRQRQMEGSSAEDAS